MRWASNDDEATKAHKTLAARRNVGEAVPVGVIDALRDAFVKALADPQAIADAERQRLVITTINGADLERIVKELYVIPAEVITKLKAALEGQ
jgi:tripartite-type tricarboxylate transporter receptor subunit TctC